jgi:hypothetical protein
MAEGLRRPRAICFAGGMHDQDRSLRERVVRYRADPELSREDAAARISAYVYGNILVFATVVPLSDDDIHHWHGALLILGVAASTYLAHVYADLVGRKVKASVPMTRAQIVHELRDATPVLSSGMVPALLAAAGALHWLEPGTAVLCAEIYLFGRMALLGLLVERLNSDRFSGHTFFAGLMLASAAAAISLIKVTIAH